MLWDLDASSTRTLILLSVVYKFSELLWIFKIGILTFAGRWTPLNVAPPSGTTLDNLEMTPKDSLILSVNSSPDNDVSISP
jgi:hypothetical protein